MRLEWDPRLNHEEGKEMEKKSPISYCHVSLRCSSAPTSTLQLVFSIKFRTMAEILQLNSTFLRPNFFILTGFPRLGSAQTWLTLVFGPTYLLALLGNGALLAMFFVHALAAMESGVLLAMACDRAVATGCPLHYSVLFTKARVGYAALALALKAVAIVVPFPLLVAKFEHFQAKTIGHTYCAHMAVVELVVGNKVYGLALSLVISVLTSVSFIAHTVLQLPSREACAKAFGTCSSHICVILAFYIPGLFSYLTHRFGHHTVPKPVHILLSNIYLLLPPALNPLIYGARTKQIRDRLLETFRFRKSLL
ncbi:Olfactory receptor 52W1 [Plecturocebus cupreus]